MMGNLHRASCLGAVIRIHRTCIGPSNQIPYETVFIRRIRFEQDATFGLARSNACSSSASPDQRLLETASFGQGGFAFRTTWRKICRGNCILRFGQLPELTCREVIRTIF